MLIDRPLPFLEISDNPALGAQPHSAPKRLTHRPMKRTLALLFCFGSLPHKTLHAQDPRTLIQQAVDTELRADREDHSRWRYRDDERTKQTVSVVVQTDAGAVKRPFLRNGHPLSPEEVKAEDNRIQAYIHDPVALAKTRRDAQSDDKSATAFLQMLPTAFIWRITGEAGDHITLHFQPDPNFHPPDMQARVLAVMAGDLTVSKAQHRIVSIRGALTQDVNLGFGMLGRIRQGGTFDVERREVAPDLWQITETHVHIEGKALFFKTIGQQQDEIQTDFKQVPGPTTLDQAAEMSKHP